MNPAKLSLYFSVFSKIFYTIYKNQQRHFIISDSFFAARALEGFRFLHINPYFVDWPSEKLESLKLGPWGRQRRSGGNSGRGSPDSGRGTAGEWPKAD
jgi:hypothetical protein